MTSGRKFISWQEELVIHFTALNLQTTHYMPVAEGEEHWNIISCLKELRASACSRWENTKAKINILEEVLVDLSLSRNESRLT